MAFLESLVPPSRRESVQVDCPGCGVSFKRSGESFQVGEYRVHRCPVCRSVATFPLPTEATLRAHYARYNEEYSAGMGQERYQREMPKRWAARLDLLQQHGAAGRLLDLAGSNGMFGSIAHARGFQVDIADFITEPKDLGFTVARPANLNERGSVPFPDHSFDVVTLWSCIEHVVDPDACISEIVRLVRPGGLVCVDTPLVGDVCEGLFPARSHWICPPEHLHLFSNRGLCLALERGGLEVLVSSPFFERTKLRWLARRGRNVAVAAMGALIRAASADSWATSRSQRETPAGDIQVVLARAPR